MRDEHTPPGRRRALTTLFVTVLLDMLGFGMILPLLPFYAQSLGASDTLIGVLFASFSGAQLVFAPLLGRLSDRLGRRPVLVGSIFCGVLAYLLFAAAPAFSPYGFAALLVARFFAGASAANFAIAPAYIADVMPAEERSKGMGLLGAAFGLGFIGGPALGGVLGLWGHAAVALGAAVLAAVNFVLAVAWLPESLPPERRGAIAAGPWPAPRGLARLRHQPALLGLMVLFFVVTFCFSLMEATLALFCQDRFGFGQRSTAWLFVFIGLVLVVVQGGLVGPLARRFGDRRLVAAGMTLMAGGLIALPQPGTVPFFATVLASLAIGSALYNPSLLALLSRITDETSQGEVMGLSRSFGSLARMLGPLTGTWIFDHVGPPWPFRAGGTLAAISLGLCWVVLRRVGPAGDRRKPPAASTAGADAVEPS